jgi:hypothetical protein
VVDKNVGKIKGKREIMTGEKPTPGNMRKNYTSDYTSLS